MLKVSLHYAKPAETGPHNVLGRLDIGYSKLDAMADYKAVMFTTGIGEQPPVQVTAYPRWSASVWDLVARVVCLSLGRAEAASPAILPYERKGAFIDDMTAVIEHWPGGQDLRRATVGIAHVQRGRRRGAYTATFEDDILGKTESTRFVHTPLGLAPWDLLARAYAWSVHERFELPPRPTLYTPIPVQLETQSLVALDTVSEPARTGIQRWLSRQGLPATRHDLVSSPCVSEAQFVEFLRRAL